MKMNLQAGRSFRESKPGIATPDIRSRTICSEGGSGETFLILTPRDLQGSPVLEIGVWGRVCEGNDKGSKSLEKSDHPIVVRKPSNVGGAKGMTN